MQVAHPLFKDILCAKKHGKNDDARMANDWELGSIIYIRRYKQLSIRSTHDND